MKNQGMFSTLFIEDLKGNVALDDAAKGRMQTLSQTWRNRDKTSTDTLWDSFLKQALGYLEFVPREDDDTPGVYILFEDWGYSNCIGVLYLAPPDSDLDDKSVGSFFPAKLVKRLKKLKLNWGILTNGSEWRLYSLKSSRPFEDFVELDLQQTLKNSDEDEYGLFERFFHRNSFIEDDSGEESQDKSRGVYKCRLDLDREQSEQVLEERVKKPFLTQVDEVLQYVCNGFIFDTNKSGEEYTEEERAEIFESAVKLIYRCLFLFYAESRRLLPSDPEKAEIYLKYSIASLCREARRFKWGERRDTHEYDLWKHLKGLISAVNDGDPEYGIMGYNGGLFDDEEELFLGQHQLRNDFIARALYLLAYVEPVKNEPEEEYAIPYEDLEVRHLGEVYENILEYTVMLADADRIRRRTKNGAEILLASGTERKEGDVLIKKGEVYFGESALERKQTGSYYTPESLVRFLNEKAIIKPLYEIFENKYRKRFEELLQQAGTAHDAGTRTGAVRAAVAQVEQFVNDELLGFRVCDPAMGSGHFLVDAANQMTGLVIELLEEIPFVEDLSLQVDSDPNRWRRIITRHCIYGVDINPLAVNLAKLSLWLNCFASEHRLTFLDHHLRCGNSLIGIRNLSQLNSIPLRKKEKKKKNSDQRLLFDYDNLSQIVSDAAGKVASITEINEDDTEAQKEVLDEVREQTSPLQPLADLYTAYLMDSKISPDDYRDLFENLAKDKPLTSSLNSDIPEIYEKVESYKDSHHFFHWALEFPDVFGSDSEKGFSATIGNPPWDIVKPSSQEFFSAYDPDFRKYKKQEANKVSKELMAQNPSISEKWNKYCKEFEQQSIYFREPESYRALGKGDINTFKLFLEQFFRALKDNGSMGIIVPSGIYTDQGCQPLREMFFNESKIDFLYCFENRWPTVFNGVDGRFKFVSFVTKKGDKTNDFKCAFMEHDPERLPLIDSNALKMNVEQVKKFSPESLSIMEFKHQRDIDVTTKIYGDLPLLGDKLEDTWNVSFRSELHMTNDSHLFKTEPTDCPLYEGKMIWHFDSHFDEPRYWLERDEVEEALGSSAWEGKHYRVGFRNIGRNTDSRTLICTIIPPSFHGNNLPTISPFNSSDDFYSPNNSESLSLTSLLASFVVDFVIRQKVSASLNYFYMYSLPLIREFKNEMQNFIFLSIQIRSARLICNCPEFINLWKSVFYHDMQNPDFWYPPSAYINNYGPLHEQEIRKRLRDEAVNLTPEWGPHCGVHDRLPDRRDTGDRAQLRAEIDAYVAHLYGLTRDDFSYILDTFPVLKRKEEKVFGEFMSKRKCLEEYDRIALILENEEQNNNTE